MYNSIDNVKHISWLEYMVMFYMLCISGNPLFIYAESKLLYALSLIMFWGLCLIKKKHLYNRNLGLWLFGSCMLFLLQYLLLDLTSLNADINFIARLYIAFLCASFFGVKFREVYFKVMVALCIVSIPCFILQLNGFRLGYEVDRYRSILVYSFLNNGERNAGMFWEPGAFQGFIMMVPLLYSNKLKMLWKTHKKGCVILLLALLSTQSTTGYIAFAAFLFFTILLNGKINVLLKSCLIAVSIIVFTYVWAQDFMGEKIMEQYEHAQNMQQGEVSWDRMSVMYIDFYNIQRHPLIGNGFMDKSRYGILGEYMRGAGNGFTGAINMFGVPFMLLYFIGIFRNFSSFSKSNRYVLIFVFILMLNGEYFLNYPLFWSLLFIKNTKDEINSSFINRS